MNTLLFAVGICVFMITIYGAVMAGGMALQQQQRRQLAPDVEVVVNDDGYDVYTSSVSARTDHSDAGRPTVTRIAP